MTDLTQTGGLSEYGKLSNSNVTAIFTASGATRIRSVQAGENTGGATPTLTVEVYDPSTGISYSKRKAKAFDTAGSEILYVEPFYLNPGWQVRLQSGDAAGKIDWCITYDAPAAAGRLR